MCREYIEFRQNITGGSRPIRHPECDNGASSRIGEDDQDLFIEARFRPGVGVIITGVTGTIAIGVRGGEAGALASALFRLLIVGA